MFVVISEGLISSCYGLGQGGNKTKEVRFRDIFSLSFSFLYSSFSSKYCFMGKGKEKRLKRKGWYGNDKKKRGYGNNKGIIVIKGRLLNLLLN